MICNKVFFAAAFLARLAQSDIDSQIKLTAFISLSSRLDWKILSTQLNDRSLYRCHQGRIPCAIHRDALTHRWAATLARAHANRNAVKSSIRQLSDHRTCMTRLQLN